MRKCIARVLTVLSEKRITQARDAHKKDKHAPKDLRQKKTRAFRKSLSQFEAKKMTLRQQKKTDNFKVRKFALIA